jgi:hypothetical protein
MSQIREALRSGNFVCLSEAAHQLVRTVGTTSTVTAEIAATLEEAALRQHPERCVALIARVRAMCDALLIATAKPSYESLLS